MSDWEGSFPMLWAGADSVVVPLSPPPPAAAAAPVVLGVPGLNFLACCKMSEALSVVLGMALEGGRSLFH